MKRWHFLVVLCLAFVVKVNAQTSPDGGGVRMTQGLDPLYAHLEFTMEPIKLQACSGEQLQFTLRLNFTNKGKNAVILDKRNTAVPRYMISRNFKNAIKKKYETEGEFFFGLDGMTMDSVLDESQFVILKSGETYSSIQVLTCDISADSDNDGSKPLRGYHVLQMVVETWYHPRASNIEWRERWKTKGYLWSDPITSIPMPFMIEKNPAFVDCP